MLRNWTIFNKLPSEQLIRIKHIHVFDGGRSALYTTSGDIMYAVGVNNSYNLLGLSGRPRSFSVVVEPVSVERLSLKSIYTIAVGDYFGVANNTKGELYHWGRRMDKRRGILLPHQVKCPYFVTDIACGSEFFVILTKEQKVYFRGTFQQHDHSTLEFTEISLGLTVSYVSCGIFHVAMLARDGQVYTCGYDHHATYKSWKSEEGLIPKKMELREQCVQVVCGRRSTVCVVTSGSVWACGENENLGVESDNAVMKQPTKIKIPEPIRELAATWFSNIYAASAWNGRIYSWGNKTRWPTILTNACVLLDAFCNKETPSNLGLVPVAPQLTPCSSFNDKTAVRKPMPRTVSMSYDVSQRLERSLSADDLNSARYTDDPSIRKVEPTKVPPEPSKRTLKPALDSSKQAKHPPGLGLLISAGKYLATRPSDKQSSNVKLRPRAVSPEAHPSKVPKPSFTVAGGKSANLNSRSQSMENLDQSSPPSKRRPRVLSVIFGKNSIDGKKTPVSSPEAETSPTNTAKFFVDRKDLPENSSSNPFLRKDSPMYPPIPMPVDETSTHAASREESKENFDAVKPDRRSMNPFWYDPITAVEFEFPREAAQCYVNRRESVANPSSSLKSSDLKSTTHNPGTRALLDYYCVLADVKSDMIELQNMINELANVVADL